MPEGFCKVILLSIATSWQWQGIKASGPPLATFLLGSVQVELQPHGAAQGEKGFESDLRGAQQRCSSGSQGSRCWWQSLSPRAPFLA